MAVSGTKGNVIAATDLSKWRLKNERGRQTWWYDADGEFGRDSNFLERHSLGLDTVSKKSCRTYTHAYPSDKLAASNMCIVFEYSE